MNSQVIIAVSSIFFGGLLLGHTLTQCYYEAEIAKLNAEGMTADVKALETQITTERDYKNVQDKAEKTALADYDDISRKYSLALSRGVLESSRSTDTTKVSNTTATASQTAKTCNCGRSRQDYENLRKDCLLIAKERDEIAVDKNELIKLYNQVRTYGTPDNLQKDSRPTAIRKER